MHFLGSILIIFGVLNLSLCIPLPAPKGKPVNLKYMCMQVTSEEDKSDKAPIILLHGLSASKESWLGIYQVIALQTGRKVCAADLRNHGDSPRSDDSDTASMSEDIAHLINTIKAKKVILLGHSLGGKIAVHTSLTHPEKVEKVIIEDMRPNGITPEALREVQGILHILISVVKDIPKELTDQEAKALVLDRINKFLAKVNSTLVLDERFAEVLPLRCSDGKWEWKTNMALLDKVMKNPLKLLVPSSGIYKGPALFIYGSESNFKVGEDEENILKLFPNAKLVSVKGASHMVHEKPQFLTEVLNLINKG